MNDKVYEFEAEIKEVLNIDGAYIEIPLLILKGRKIYEFNVNAKNNAWENIDHFYHHFYSVGN